MLPDDAVRGVSVALSVLFLLGARPRSQPFRRTEPDARASRPLDIVTGPLWVALNVLSFIAFVVEATVPGWVYEGPVTLAVTGAVALQMIGLAVWSLGAGIHWWASRVLGRHNLLQIKVGPGHQLITSGPYRLVRHPMYAAVLLMNTGAALFLLNAALLVLVSVTYVVALRRAVLEEGLLGSQAGFGEEYREYAARTGRFLPRTRARGE